MTFLVMPPRARSRTLGTLTVTSPAATRRHGPQDLIMGEALGPQAIFALNSPEFAAHGLLPVLWALVRAFRERVHFDADLILTGKERPLPTEVAEAMYGWHVRH